MPIQPNSTSIAGYAFSVFWFAIYALALVLLFASRVWLTITDSGRAKKETSTTYPAANSPLNYKTT